MALMFFGPLLTLVACLVALDGGRPVFAHRRVGKGGRIFFCYKVRTMGINADQQLASLLATCPEAAAEWATRRKLSNDPRVTWIGKLLRKTRLDELPQLINVLKGEMSLVGPRPITSEELEMYGAAAVEYISVRPGVTGPWQAVSRRKHREPSYDERVALDVMYVANISLTNDLKIMLRSFVTLLELSGE